ncbi:MAG: glutathione S-transferase family protein [Gammaproteobacteria bacterium]|nr:glutathione S-transferase family protein [Gammaproteobacteria bacterium]
MLVNGKWSKDFDPVQAVDEDGRFIRQDSQFRNWITPDGSAGITGKAGFKAESERYHLYVALICPWACRTLMARKIKKLEALISVSVVEPYLQDECWSFGAYPGADIEPLYGFKYAHQLYTRADGNYSGQVTVPVLWDKQQHTIVNNESADIVRMLNSGFGDLADNTVDLYPLDLRAEIDAVNERLYDSFNNGVYQAGFASTQFAYEEAVAKVFDSLAFLQQQLEGQDYLVGNRLTEADIRAFVTLIRFDTAYYGLFKTNLAQVRDYPTILAYMQRIYALPGVAETVNFDHIKQGYYSIKMLNPLGIIPQGPDLSYITG